MTDPRPGSSDSERPRPPAQRVQEHYRTVLGPMLTWMLGGDIAQVVQDQQRLLDDLLPKTSRAGTALDLGAGSGAQTLALRRLGLETVTAVDTDRGLLTELETHARDTGGVTTVHDDALSATGRAAPHSIDVMVCMGDTLTHLDDHATVTHLLRAAARALRAGGALVLTYRDLSADLRDTDRFIPVRASRDIVMTCFIDARSEHVVDNYDIVHRRTADSWSTQVSAYPKLRLASDWVAREVADAGLRVVRHDQGQSGMWRTVAVAPGRGSD